MNYFDPKLLTRMKHLSLRARCIVDGVMVGIHPSRAKGLNAEFEEHRGYTQGDDIRHIDWKAYAKSDRYFIKEYREATNLRATLLIDSSASMAYASDGVSKFDYGSTLGASLAYLLLKQQDSLSLITFSDRIERALPPKATHEHLFAILRELEERTPSGETSTGAVLQEIASSTKRRGLVILISDLLDRPEEVIRGLRQLRSRGNDILVFHLLDKDELDFPFREPTIFQDLEEDLKLLADPHAVRKAYLETMGSLIETYKQACAVSLIDYALFDTSVGLDRALVRYLTWREKFRAR